APGGAGQLLHPVPLPRGGGQPADDRRDRPVRQDPRVQVLRGPDRAGPPRGPVMARARERAPGVEARAGRFPGPSLIPALHATRGGGGWLAGGERGALPRAVRRPLYEIGGLIPFYPPFRPRPPATVEVHACHDLSCWLQGADRRIAELRERYAGDAEVEVT